MPSRRDTMIMCTTQDYYTIDITEPTTTDAGTFRIRVVSDPHVPNPRKDYDQLGTWVSWKCGRYDLPNEVDNDPRVTYRVADAYEDHHYYGAAYAVRYLSTVCGAVALPVYGDDRTSAGKLDERIDGGARITGVIYVRRADIASQWAGYGMPSDAEIAEWLAAEVDQYATWANGEMVSYDIERLTCGHWDCDETDHWEEVTSGGGSYFSVDEAIDVAREDIPTEPTTPVHVPKRQCVGCTEVEGGRDFPGHVHQWAGAERTVQLSASASAVIAGLVAPSSAGIDVDGIQADDTVWAEIRAAFPVSLFHGWVTSDER